MRLEAPCHDLGGCRDPQIRAVHLVRERIQHQPEVCQGASPSMAGISGAPTWRVLLTTDHLCDSDLECLIEREGSPPPKNPAPQKLASRNCLHKQFVQTLIASFYLATGNNYRGRICGEQFRTRIQLVALCIGEIQTGA